MTSLIRLACLLCLCLGMTACAPMLSLIGTNQTLVQVVAQGERVKLAGDGASYVTSKKTVTDHAISIVTGKDCKLFNVLDKQSVCKETDTVALANPDKQPQAASTAEATAQPQTQATARPNPPAIELAHDEASGD